LLLYTTAVSVAHLLPCIRLHLLQYQSVDLRFVKFSAVWD
jgi:hypothetical protein